MIHILPFACICAPMAAKVSSRRSERRVRPSYETPAISAGADAARRVLCPASNWPGLPPARWPAFIAALTAAALIAEAGRDEAGPHQLAVTLLARKQHVAKL
jgi:hypothetical protein